MGATRLALLGGTRLAETSRGPIGLHLGGFRPGGTVLPWRGARWLRPGDTIDVKPTAPDLTDALIKAGLPDAEASALAVSVLDEWGSKLAEIRSRRWPSAKLGLHDIARPTLVFTVWVIGVGYLSRRLWRLLV
jgi:hypothetical protein